MNIFSEKKRRGRKLGEEVPLPRDPDASWTAKSRPKTDKDGKKYIEKTYYYGYKLHTAINENDIITSLKPTSARESDGAYFLPLIKQTQQKDIPVLYAGGDKAYDDAVLMYVLEHDLGVMSCIKTKRTRTTTGDVNQQHFWDEYEEHMERLDQQKKRGYVERPYADMKHHHDFRRARYLGLAKFAMQSYLTAAVHNIKRHSKCSLLSHLRVSDIHGTVLS